MQLPNSKCPVEGGNLLLPTDILRIISNKFLRLILDEIEDDNCLSLKRARSVMDNLYNKYINKRPQYYESSNNIDFIIKLIRAKNIGADPNTKNYKGNTILYLLNNEFLGTDYLGTEDSEYQILLDKINLLHKYGSNGQIKNREGNTIAHLLIFNYITQGRWENRELNMIHFLQSLDMSIDNTKNNIGYTAYDLGCITIDSKFDSYTAFSYQLKLDKLLFREREIKNNIIIKDINKLKSYDSIKIKTL